MANRVCIINVIIGSYLIGWCARETYGIRYADHFGCCDDHRYLKRCLIQCSRIDGARINLDQHALFHDRCKMIEPAAWLLYSLTIGLSASSRIGRVIVWIFVKMFDIREIHCDHRSNYVVMSKA